LIEALIVESSMILQPSLNRARHVVALAFSLITATVHADIIFTAKIAGPSANIFAVDKSGKIKKLTDDINWRDLDQSVSPDGLVVFSSNREKEAKIDMYKSSEDFDIFIVKQNGKSLRPIAASDSNEVMPKFSPDGKRIGYLLQSGEKRELVVMKPKGSDSHKLLVADDIVDFSWSPDSKKIVCATLNGTDSEMMIVDAAGGGEPQGLVKVSTAPAPEGAKNTEAFLSQIVSAQWSPDGEKIAYINHPLKQDIVRRLHVFNLKTGGDLAVSDPKVQVQYPVTWSADSGKLLYSALVGYKFYYDEKVYKKVYKGGMHIFLSSLDGEKIENRQLTTGDVLFKAPIFSPDEKQMAFLYADALEARTVSLRTMNMDGTDMKQLYDSVVKSTQLQWIE
jgi:TolB protein